MKAERIVYIMVIILLLGIIIYSRTQQHEICPTITTTIDTVYITDSIIIEKPQYITKYITHHTTDTVYSVDSIPTPVYIPIETIIYQDSTPTYKYKAIVSGYKPQLEELNIYTSTPQYNTTITKYKPYKWSVSLGASYNIKGELYPAINIGYNIFSW